MFKKIASLLLAVLMVASLAVVFSSCNKTTTDEENGPIGFDKELPLAESGVVRTVASDVAEGTKVENFKVGVILVGDESEGYSEAHIAGINAAAEALGVSADSIIWKKKVDETENCYNAAKELVAAGCQIIFSNSYGHQDYMKQAASEFSDVQFVAMTGDTAAASGLDNFSNAFTSVYESRYVAGVVAGMKLAELVADGKVADSNKDADGNIKLGYVGAFNYAEVVSGYTAFFLGVQSIVPNTVMEVKYTDSWGDVQLETSAADYLINNGCVIIGQHADTVGAPGRCEKALSDGGVAYSVGYNLSMLEAAPNAALVSSANTWEKYYTKLLTAWLNKEPLPQDWHEGYETGAVGLTEFGASCAPGTAEKVAEVVDALKAGTLHVFDTSKFTVGGEHITSCVVNFSYLDWSQGGKVVYEGPTLDTVKTDSNGVTYVEESVVRSAPYFAIRIDGITETAK